MRRIVSAPKQITLGLLEVAVMPNGEIISLGKTLGWVKDFKTVLFEPEAVKIK